MSSNKVIIDFNIKDINVKFSHGIKSGVIFKINNITNYIDKLK